ncbi:PQQ-binding-like beta-propeller repeat protein [Myroides odoratus]|uniref:outer membrane protein assembly factor BamB family protein n=1 Tax=Myroides odoratus TaxID=256 RepID=UPI003340C78C
MYRLLKRYSNTSLVDIAKDDSFFVIDFNEKQVIQKITKDFVVKWESEEKDIFSGKIINDRIFYSTLDGRLLSRRLIDLEFITKIDHLEKHILFNRVWNNQLLCFNSNRHYVLIDLENLRELKKFQITDKEKFVSLFYQNRFIVKSKREDTFFPGVLQAYDIDFQLIWQHDFTEDCRFINYSKIDRDENERLPGQIEDIVLFGEDKLIVSCKYSKVFCIEILTGKILWENTFTGNREYIIVGDIGYAYSNGGGIHKIDLKTGASLHEDKRFHRLPEMPYYNNLHISTATDTIIYHDGLLWGLIYSNGYSFVVAIHPDTYQYEWIHRVETTEKVMSIQFYNDRMYLNTSGSDWFIYEKNK